MPDISDIISNIKTWNKQLKKIQKQLEIYEKIRADAINNSYLLEKKVTEIEKATAALHDQDTRGVLDAWLQNEKASLGKFKEDFRFQFGQHLKELFSKEAKKISGQYPVLRIGLFTLKLNFEFGDATLFFGPEVEKLKSRIPLQPQVICDTVKRYEKDIKDEHFDAVRVLDDLVAAYRRCLILSERAYGDKVRITDVLKEYVFLKQPKQFMIDASKGHFQEYSRIKLSYMLYRLKRANVTEMGFRLHVATFDATVDKVRSFWVPDSDEGEGTHYEYISFGVTQE